MPKISLLEMRLSPAWKMFYVRKQVALCPNNAMDRLAWSTPYCTDWEALRHLLGVAVVAFRFTLAL